MDNNIIECYHCGLFLKRTAKKIVCPRCKHTIKNKKNHSIDSLYYAITALLLFILLNTYPLIHLSFSGNSLNTTLFNTVIVLYKQDFIFVSLVVLFTVIIAPIFNCLVIIAVFIQNMSKRKPFNERFLYNSFKFFKTWGLTEVFVISIIVTYIKLIGLVSSTRFDMGFYVMLVYLLSLYLSNRKFNIYSVLA